MTIETFPGRARRTDKPLAGAAALHLYLTEISRNLSALTAQSALLLQALNERARLLREIEAGKGAGSAAERAGPKSLRE